MYTLCEKVRNLEPYEPISGTYRIRLDANESFYSVPEEIKVQIKRMIDSLNFNRYPDSTAKTLVSAFADFYDINPENVTATNGSDEMLYLLSSAILPKNSKVLVLEPDFSMYNFYSFLSENEIISIKKPDSLKIDVNEVIQVANNNNVDMIIFSNPCNPTGQGLSADETRKLVKSVKSLVVLDEAYMDFWDESLLKEVIDYDNLIILKTASKAVGFAAIRLGFAVANKTLTRALQAVKSPYNVNTLTQEIGTVIYQQKDLITSRCKMIIENTKELYDVLLKMKQQYKLPINIFEPCTNFVFIESDFTEELYKYLLDNGIAVRYFSNLSALRITSGNKEENKELLIYIEKYILEKYIDLKR